MPSLYKKPVLIKDPKTGQKMKTKSAKWWGQYKDADGKLRRRPLATDKLAAQMMLSELVRQVERVKAGLVDPTEHQRQRPLAEHLREFLLYLEHKGVTPKHVKEMKMHIQRMIDAGKWRLVADIGASSVLGFLANLRRQRRSVQTSNHYLKSVKQFTRWLVRYGRTPHDALVHISKLNVATDRRHDRRALSAEEFSRLLSAARSGPTIEGIPGPDRAMMYFLAAWTGFRKGEIGSLTPQSFDLTSDPPTGTVAAAYSKRRRRDTQVLHGQLAAELQAWLASRGELSPQQVLFPISRRVPGCTERKTHAMIQRDLARAREQWLTEAPSPAERRERTKSDFLAYRNHAGLYADFHSCRHFFITNLERAGISPKMAQTLARHSDIRLTLQVYTHVELSDQVAAIQALPGPERGRGFS